MCVRFRAGVCVPQECGLSDVPALLNPLLQHVSNGTVPPLTLDNLMGQCGDFHFKATPSTSLSTAFHLICIERGLCSLCDYASLAYSDVRDGGGDGAAGGAGAGGHGPGLVAAGAEGEEEAGGRIRGLLTPRGGTSMP